MREWLKTNRKRLGAAVVDDERDLACTLPVVDRAGNRADFVCSKVTEYKLRGVEQRKHHHVVLTNPVRAQCMRQAVGLGVQLRIGPAAAGNRVVQR